MRQGHWGLTTPTLYRRYKSKGRPKSKKGTEVISECALPTPEEMARDFVKQQPRKVKRNLRKSAIAAYGEASAFWKDGFESDTEDALESDDEEQ